MAYSKVEMVELNEKVGNVKRQKVLTLVGKQKKKRVATFTGLVAKLQQSIDNGEEQFVYFATKKIVAFLTVLRENGVIHNFHTITKKSQWSIFGAYLSPTFDAKVLVVYLKTLDKHGPSLRSFRMFTIPSRSVAVSYIQLTEKSKAAGASALYVLNTSKGLLTHITALRYKIGGEIVCEIK